MSEATERLDGSIERLSLGGKLAVAARDIKLAHSVFALPFAVLGAFLAAPIVGLRETHPGFLPRRSPGDIVWDRFGGQLALVVLCMVIARTFAMLANRFVDRRLDALNPRTKTRAFAAGRLSHRDAVLMLAGSVSLFTIATAGFGVFFGNWLPLLAGPLVLAWLAFYSYTKRFTALCHVVLGVALALSPVAAAVAVGGLAALGIDPDARLAYQLVYTPTVGSAGPRDLLLLAAFVALWVAGFDVIYAMQDGDFDASHGLHSIPSRLGLARATQLARILHASAAMSLLTFGLFNERLGSVFLIATLLTLALLIAEHAILAAKGHKAIPLVFFTLNGVVAILLGVGGVIDVVRG